ncbi:hypothetical protein Tco_1048477, partial [Tanacetum coccineum]
AYRYCFWASVWRLAMEACYFTLCIWGFGVYCAGDVLNCAFLASRLQSVGLQIKLLWHAGIVNFRLTFDDALCVFNTSMETELLSIPSVPLFSISKPCSTCSRVFVGDTYEDHDVSCAGIAGIKHCHNVVRDTLVDICYRSRILAGKEIYIGLDGGRDKPLCLADMMLYSWNRGLDVCVDLIRSSPLTQTKMANFVPGRAVIDVAQRKRVKYETHHIGKGVDIGLGGWRDKPLHPADMLLYSWDEGLDVCVDLTGSSPLTQTGLGDFVPGRAVMDAAHRKRVKYEVKCGDIGYGFLPFSFSSLGELEKDAVTLLKRIRKFSKTQDIEARVIPCSACSKVFTEDIYGDHVVSRAGIIGIKHRHNVVRDTLVDICFPSGILAGKKVDISLDEGCDKPLHHADMLLYSWDE